MASPSTLRTGFDEAAYHEFWTLQTDGVTFTVYRDGVVPPN